MIRILNELEIEQITRNAKVLNGMLAELYQAIGPGISGKDLDRLALNYMQAHQVKSSFYNYQGFPGQICVSVNANLIHGIPNHKRFQIGDLVSVDAGCQKKGLHTDAAFTKIVGSPNQPEDQALVDTTRKALKKALAAAGPHVRIGTLSAIVAETAHAAGFYVNTDYAGHGIGYQLHLDPSIPNQGTTGTGPRLLPGMVVCLEPMLQMGSPLVQVGRDGWTVQTRSGGNSAHFEAMVLITEAGTEQLTEIF